MPLTFDEIAAAINGAPAEKRDALLKGLGYAPVSQGGAGVTQSDLDSALEDMMRKSQTGAPGFDRARAAGAMDASGFLEGLADDMRKGFQGALAHGMAQGTAMKAFVDEMRKGFQLVQDVSNRLGALEKHLGRPVQSGAVTNAGQLNDNMNKSHGAGGNGGGTVLQDPSQNGGGQDGGKFAHLSVGQVIDHLKSEAEATPDVMKKSRILEAASELSMGGIIDDNTFRSLGIAEPK